MSSYWEDRFNALAVFNSEKSMGIVHTEEYSKKMHEMQIDYDKKRREWLKQNGIIEI